MVPLTFRLVITEEIRVFQQYRSTCGIRHFAPNDWGGSQAEIQTKPLPKLLVRFFIGGRDGDCAKWFMDDLAARMANRRPAYEDGHRAYLEAVEGAFGADVDYAQLVKAVRCFPREF
jgi:hypothetical protein